LVSSTGGAGVIEFTASFGEPKFNELTSNQTHRNSSTSFTFTTEIRATFLTASLYLQKLSFSIETGGVQAA
tara:strand:+ start:1923 stop:2135 length:213 start_codon:yes stop_codon:yes gene_type:complete